MILFAPAFLAIASMQSFIAPARGTKLETFYFYDPATHVMASQTVVVPPAGSAFSAAYFYDLKSKNSSAVVLDKLTTATDLFGHKNWSVDLSAFAGAQLVNSNPIVGFLVDHSFALAANVSAMIGAGFSVANGQPSGFGLAAGFSVRF